MKLPIRIERTSSGQYQGSGAPRTRLLLSIGALLLLVAAGGLWYSARPGSRPTPPTEPAWAARWRGAPSSEVLRPPLPGAVIEEARFLGGGEVAVVTGVADAASREAWLLRAGRPPRRLGPPGAAGVALALSPDGARVALITQVGGGPGDERGARLWIAPSSGASPGRVRWRVGGVVHGAPERLADVSWSPDGGRLLVAVRREEAAAGARSRLLLLDAEGRAAPRELARVPGEPLPGSWVWSPRGDAVALLAGSEQGVALCLVATAGPPAFRSLADVARSTDRAPRYTPLSWSPDGRRAAYSALPAASTPAGDDRSGVYELELATGRSTPLGAGYSPAYAEEGAIVAFARPKPTEPPVLRAYRRPLDGTAIVRDLGPAPFDAQWGQPSALWDVAHRRAILASPDPAAGGGTRYRLLSWLSQGTER